MIVPTWAIRIFEDHVRRHRRPCPYCEYPRWTKAQRVAGRDPAEAFAEMHGGRLG